MRVLRPKDRSHTNIIGRKQDAGVRQELIAGRDIEELNAAFADTIADDRDWCKVRGVEQEKPGGCWSGEERARIASTWLSRRL
jgi:hypothetical protein